MNQQTDKQALQAWEEFLEGIRNATPVDHNETEEEKASRMMRLEKPGNQEEWIKYYFPKYAFSEPAKFHKESTKRFLKAKRLYQVRAWARGLSKSTRRMMEVFYKSFAQKFPTNMLLVSKTEGNAIRLLAPYKGNLEANQRLINDYGPQERIGKWKEEEFISRSKKAFRAVGAEQSPRGSRVEELRPNLVVFDDVDDDEVCRNEDRLDARWTWCEKAVIPTVDISADYCICWDNNIIAEDSLIKRAQRYATDYEEIGIRTKDKSGKMVSSWPEKNSEKDIDDIEGSMSYESFQGEYMNDPMSKGVTFDEIRWGQCPPLEELSYVIQYADPSTSNRDKPSLKSNAHTSCKSTWLIGKKGPQYFVYKGYLDVMSNNSFVDCLYANDDFVGQRVTCYHYIENNSLQAPFFEQVLLPLISEKGMLRGRVLGVLGDARDKPDKWVRIEGTLEPINRLGNLIFNIEEKDNPHMLRLVAQFKSAKATSKKMDGPDSIEGGVFILRQKDAVIQAGGIQVLQRPKNPKRH